MNESEQEEAAINTVNYETQKPNNANGNFGNYQNVKEQQKFYQGANEESSKLLAQLQKQQSKTPIEKLQKVKPTINQKKVNDAKDFKSDLNNGQKLLGNNLSNGNIVKKLVKAKTNIDRNTNEENFDNSICSNSSNSISMNSSNAMILSGEQSIAKKIQMNKQLSLQSNFSSKHDLGIQHQVSLESNLSLGQFQQQLINQQHDKTPQTYQKSTSPFLQKNKNNNHTDLQIQQRANQNSDSQHQHYEEVKVSEMKISRVSMWKTASGTDSGNNSRKNGHNSHHIINGQHIYNNDTNQVEVEKFNHIQVSTRHKDSNNEETNKQNYKNDAFDMNQRDRSQPEPKISSFNNLWEEDDNYHIREMPRQQFQFDQDEAPMVMVETYGTQQPIKIDSQMQISEGNNLSIGKYEELKVEETHQSLMPKNFPKFDANQNNNYESELKISCKHCNLEIDSKILDSHERYCADQMTQKLIEEMMLKEEVPDDYMEFQQNGQNEFRNGALIGSQNSRISTPLCHDDTMEVGECLRNNQQNSSRPNSRYHLNDHQNTRYNQTNEWVDPRSETPILRYETIGRDSNSQQQQIPIQQFHQQQHIISQQQQQTSAVPNFIKKHQQEQIQVQNQINQQQNQHNQWISQRKQQCNLMLINNENDIELNDGNSDYGIEESKINFISNNDYQQNLANQFEVQRNYTEEARINFIGQDQTNPRRYGSNQLQSNNKPKPSQQINIQRPQEGNLRTPQHMETNSDNSLSSSTEILQVLQPNNEQFNLISQKRNDNIIIDQSNQQQPRYQLNQLVSQFARNTGNEDIFNHKDETYQGRSLEDKLRDLKSSNQAHKTKRPPLPQPNSTQQQFYSQQPILVQSYQQNNTHNLSNPHYQNSELFNLQDEDEIDSPTFQANGNTLYSRSLGESPTSINTDIVVGGVRGIQRLHQERESLTRVNIASLVEEELALPSSTLNIIEIPNTNTIHNDQYSQRRTSFNRNLINLNSIDSNQYNQGALEKRRQELLGLVNDIERDTDEEASDDEDEEEGQYLYRLNQRNFGFRTGQSRRSSTDQEEQKVNLAQIGQEATNDSDDDGNGYDNLLFVEESDVYRSETNNIRHFLNPQNLLRYNPSQAARTTNNNMIRPFGFGLNGLNRLLMNPHAAQNYSDDEDEDEYHSAGTLPSDDGLGPSHNVANTQFDDYEALLNLDDHIMHPVPPSLISSLPINSYTLANKEHFPEENKSCTICMCQYEIEEQYMILPCLHRFHKECITEWFQRRNTCPNCKDRVMEHFEGYQGGAAQGGSPTHREEHNFHIVDEENDELNETTEQFVQGQNIHRMNPRNRLLLGSHAPSNNARMVQWFRQPSSNISMTMRAAMLQQQSHNNNLQQQNQQNPSLSHIRQSLNELVRPINSIQQSQIPAFRQMSHGVNNLGLGMRNHYSANLQQPVNPPSNLELNSNMFNDLEEMINDMQIRYRRSSNLDLPEEEKEQHSQTQQMSNLNPRQSSSQVMNHLSTTTLPLLQHQPSNTLNPNLFEPDEEDLDSEGTARFGNQATYNQNSQDPPPRINLHIIGSNNQSRRESNISNISNTPQNIAMRQQMNERNRQLGMSRIGIPSNHLGISSNQMMSNRTNTNRMILMRSESESSSSTGNEEEKV